MSVATAIVDDACPAGVRLNHMFDAALAQLDKRVITERGDEIGQFREFATRDQLAGLSIHTLNYLLRAMERNNTKDVGWPTLELFYWHCGRPMLGSYHSEKVCPRCGFIADGGPATG